MNWLGRFLNNHVLANLTFGLVIILGAISYLQMPRAKDPEINFNWISVYTFLPGASAIDVEKRITDPLEDAIRSSVQDIRFVSSTSREGISYILIRFNQIDERTFDKRLIDLRREVQNKYTDELPEDAEDPIVVEITTSNAFPSASVVVSSAGNDENLRKQAFNVKKDLELIKGVDRVNDLGLSDPELHIRFYPERLQGLGITPADLGDTVQSYFRDVSAGDIDTKDGQWIIRIAGTNASPDTLADYPVVTANGVVPLGNLAELVRTTEEPVEIVSFNGQPSALLSITKQSQTNVIDLIDRVNAYISEKNKFSEAIGVKLHLLDDQTISTREALALMQNNALIGLTMVLIVSWIFLGTKIALLTSIGIPFTLCGTFLVLNTYNMSLNNTVLLGVVIALGMIVDDAVVVVEAIYQRILKGMDGLSAALAALKEVFAPVTTSVMTTIAAFLPLMLMPGILGEFMKVIPIVVTLALALSLFEAYWMLPAHVIATKINFKNPGKVQRVRNTYTQKLRRNYIRLLLKALRYPIISIVFVCTIFALAVATLYFEKIRFNFFESDAVRLFYVNIEMPRGTTLEETSSTLLKIEQLAVEQIYPEELRGSVAYAGQVFTETEPLFGDNVGQIMISLNPAKPDSRHVEIVADAVELAVKDVPGPVNIYQFRLSDGPPSSRAISVKIRGDDIPTIKSAADDMVAFMKDKKEYSNISLDYRPGNPELVLDLDGEAIKQTGVNPISLSRSIKAFIDGEIVTSFQDAGEEIKLRVVAKQNDWPDIDELLRQTLSLPNGKSVALGELVNAEYGLGQRNIRHYNFKRAITLEADIDEEITDTVAANKLLSNHWQQIQANYPDVNLDFSGELDDIKESLNAMIMLFLLGLGLIYIILGTQFRSYWQPLMIIATIPLAFTGVVLGLLVTNNPLSLYTLYGVVALAGISVNAAIVLISAGNSRLNDGMSVLHATVYAARRRVIPVLITSLTTIAGLFSLATGLAGKSLIWGPVATAIVWGLAFSTVLTLFVIPLLFRFFMSLKSDYEHA